MNAKTLREVILADKPKEILLVHAGQIPENIASIHYSEPLKKCIDFLKRQRVKFGQFMEDELSDYYSSTGDRFRYLKTGVLETVDFGILIHASPFPDQKHDNSWTIEKMAKLFPKDRFYIAAPLGIIDKEFVKECVSRVYGRNVQLGKMTVEI